MVISKLRIALLLATLASLVACTSSPRIQSNYSDDLSFAEYRTFNIAEDEAMEGASLSGDLELYFTAAIMKVLQDRGLVKSDDPDLLVLVSVELTDVSRSPNRRNACPRYEDYTGREKDRRHGGIYGESRRPMCVYKEGQISVEVRDVARNQSFLAGTSRVRLDENDRGRNLKVSVVRDVATMFGESPVRIDPNRL